MYEMLVFDIILLSYTLYLFIYLFYFELWIGISMFNPLSICSHVIEVMKARCITAIMFCFYLLERFFENLTVLFIYKLYLYILNIMLCYNSKCSKLYICMYAYTIIIINHRMYRKKHELTITTFNVHRLSSH